jgi:hypothetical protein
MRRWTDISERGRFGCERATGDQCVKSRREREREREDDRPSPPSDLS